MSDQYRVTGSRPVSGVEPGEIVRLDAGSVNVEALIEAGHVEPVESKTSTSSRAKGKGGSDVSVQHDGRDDSGS